MTFGDAVVSAFTKYAVFSGRARRAEFWYFHLFNAIVITCLAVTVSLVFNEDAAAGLIVLYWLATIVPRYAVLWRRLQDTGRSGFYVLLVMIPFVGWLLVALRLFAEGQRGPNAYGPDPKAV